MARCRSGMRRGAPVERVFNGTDTVAEGRLQAADNTPIVTVPVGQMIRFNIASADVLHAFYTPQFLTKLDAVPVVCRHSGYGSPIPAIS